MTRLDIFSHIASTGELTRDISLFKSLSVRTHNDKPYSLENSAL